MSTKTTIHRIVGFTFHQVRNIRWLSLTDKDGNEIAIFITELDDLANMLPAIDEGVRSFKPH